MLTTLTNKNHHHYNKNKHIVFFVCLFVCLLLFCCKHNTLSFVLGERLSFYKALTLRSIILDPATTAITYPSTCGSRKKTQQNNTNIKGNVTNSVWGTMRQNCYGTNFLWEKISQRHFHQKSRKLSWQKFYNHRTCEFTAHYACKNKEMNPISTTTVGLKLSNNEFIYGILVVTPNDLA